MKQERDYEYDAPIKPFAFRSIDLSPASQGFLCEPDRYRHLETSKFKKVIPREFLMWPQVMGTMSFHFL